MNDLPPTYSSMNSNYNSYKKSSPYLSALYNSSSPISPLKPTPSRGFNYNHGHSHSYNQQQQQLNTLQALRNQEAILHSYVPPLTSSLSKLDYNSHGLNDMDHTLDQPTIKTNPLLMTKGHHHSESSPSDLKYNNNPLANKSSELKPQAYPPLSNSIKNENPLMISSLIQNSNNGSIPLATPTTTTNNNNNNNNNSVIGTGTGAGNNNNNGNGSTSGPLYLSELQNTTTTSKPTVNKLSALVTSSNELMKMTTTMNAEFGSLSNKGDNYNNSNSNNNNNNNNNIISPLEMNRMPTPSNLSTRPEPSPTSQLFISNMAKSSSSLAVSYPNSTPKQEDLLAQMNSNSMNSNNMEDHPPLGDVLDASTLFKSNPMSSLPSTVPPLNKNNLSSNDQQNNPPPTLFSTAYLPSTMMNNATNSNTNDPNLYPSKNNTNANVNVNANTNVNVNANASVMMNNYYQSMNPNSCKDNQTANKYNYSMNTVPPKATTSTTITPPSYPNAILSTTTTTTTTLPSYPKPYLYNNINAPPDSPYLYNNMNAPPDSPYHYEDGQHHPHSNSLKQPKPMMEGIGMGNPTTTTYSESMIPNYPPPIATSTYDSLVDSTKANGTTGNAMLTPDNIHNTTTTNSNSNNNNNNSNNNTNNNNKVVNKLSLYSLIQ